MLDNVIVKLPNTCKYNPYESWDRGLFISEQNGNRKVCKIESLNFITYGGSSAPGILTYSVRVYETPPANKVELNNKPFIVLGPYRSLAKNGLESALLTESTAIHCFKNQMFNVKPEDIQSIMEQGTRMVVHTTKGAITALQTTLEFKLTDGLLVQDKAFIEFTVLNQEGGSRKGSFNQPAPVDPIMDVTNYIKKRLPKQ